MKTNVLKSIIVMMIVFLAGNVNAQKRVNGIDTRNAEKCNEYLVNNPKDTIVEVFNINRDGMRGEVSRNVYLNASVLTARNDTVWFKTVEIERPSSALVQKYDTVSINSRFREKVAEGLPRDVIYANSVDAKTYRDGLNGDNSDADAGKAVLKAANKYGWSVSGGAGYSFADGVQGPIFDLGVAFDRRYWGIYLNGELGKSKLSSNAVKAGNDYWVFRAESALMIRPFQLDAYDQNRLFLLAGVGFENFKTDSMPYELEDGTTGYLSSHGNYLYATAGVAFEHRFFATGNCLGARLQWRNTRAVVQNSGDENFGSIALSLYFKFGFFRNVVSSK